MEPDIRLVPLRLIQLQEDTDRSRLDRLVARMQASGVLKDPPVVAKGLGRKLIQLDGTTRISALRALSCTHAVVQFVDYSDTSQVLIKSWVHVSKVNRALFLRRLRAFPKIKTEEFKLGLGLRLASHPHSAVTIIFRNGWGLSILSDSDLFHKVRIMRKVVELYAALITRDHEVSIEGMEQLGDFFAKHKDNNVALFFPSFAAHEIYTLMKHNVELPQGITRHIVNGRVLRINYPIEKLKRTVPMREKESYFRSFFADINLRYYEEPTLIVE